MFLFHWQLVGYEDRLYQVVEGTEMGLLHSSSVADLCYFGLVEEGFKFAAWKCSLHVRFRDDVLHIMGRVQWVQPFLTELCRRAKPCWIVKLERVSLAWVEMLDLVVLKGTEFKSTGILSHRPFVKSTARHIPLGGNSGHSSSTHKGWPIGEISRMYRLSSGIGYFWTARNRLLAKFASCFMQPETLDRVTRWRPSGPRKPRPDCSILRLVVPWYPGLRNLGRALKRLCEQWQPVLACAWPKLACAGTCSSAGQRMIELVRRRSLHNR
jgi:hypothetical protein